MRDLDKLTKFILDMVDGMDYSLYDIQKAVDRVRAIRDSVKTPELCGKLTKVSLPDFYGEKYELDGLVYGLSVRPDIDDIPSDSMSRKFVAEIFCNGHLVATLFTNLGKEKTLHMGIRAMVAYAGRRGKKLRASARRRAAKEAK